MRRKNLIYIYLSGIILVLVLLHLYIFTTSFTMKYEITNMKVKLKGLKSINRFLSSRLSADESLPEIEKKASQMGMSYPDRVNYVSLTSEGY